MFLKRNKKQKKYHQQQKQQNQQQPEYETNISVVVVHGNVNIGIYWERVIVVVVQYC